MTTHYVDIHARADAAAPAPYIIATLFERLHATLVATQQQSIGITFPGYRFVPATLGSTLRVVGPAASMKELLGHAWLTGLEDEIDVLGVAQVPASATHRVLSRVQFHTSVDRQRRRLMRRQDLTWDQARQKVPDPAYKVPDLPYIQTQSRSTEQAFRLYLRLGEPVAASPGRFNLYALSASGTTPWF